MTAGIVVLGSLVGAWPAAAGSKSGDAPPDVKVRPAQAPAGDQITCLLPADVDRLGSQVTHLGPRRRVQLTREACAARGGEIETESDAPAPEDEPHD